MMVFIVNRFPADAALLAVKYDRTLPDSQPPEKTSLMRLNCHRSYFDRVSPPASTMTAMIMAPVMINRTPALAPKILSMVTSKYMNRAAPQMPGTLARPPATDVPPMTTTAMDASRNSSPMLRAAPPENPESNMP